MMPTRRNNTKIEACLYKIAGRTPMDAILKSPINLLYYSK